MLVPAMADEARVGGDAARSDHEEGDASEVGRDEVGSGNTSVAGEETPPSSGGAAGTAEAPTPKVAVARMRKPPIDIDTRIAAARQMMKAAQKQVAAARSQARNERRKKQRLVKKAATLTPEDLERIAVLKRCGVDPAGHLDIAAGAAASSNASGAIGSGAAASSRDAAPPVSAATTPRQPGSSQPHPASAAA